MSKFKPADKSALSMANILQTSQQEDSTYDSTVPIDKQVNNKQVNNKQKTKGYVSILSFFPDDDFQLAWKYWLPNPLFPFIAFRIAIPMRHKDIVIEDIK